ncbi:MAG: TRAP transporter substrate-binding protein DctP [Hyphomicrobiaceae bacterium]|nr:TRAP transporter substrate-binding protein DctP [Hyphomicrobiaceae bacterium]MCC0011124.1 TRAP transporter substrate-binding protein DctP [Hyphomicrobiaceae bacterium]
MDLDTKGLDRRELGRIAMRYGWTSTLFALAGMTGTVTATKLAKAADETAAKRKPAKFTWKFGASGFNESNLKIQKSGQLFFAKDIEERTDGEIRIEFIGSNQICGQLDCVQKTQQGIVQVYSASTQNSAGNAPYYNVLDFAYMFPTRASQYHFFYSPKSMKVFREPLEQRHKIKFLFTHCELRGLMLGKKWADKPTVTKIEDLAGTKNRVTGTQLGRIAMQLLNLNPVPIAWEETLDGLRQGLIDGAETWMGAAAYANMAPVLSQAVNLQFFCGTEHTAMSASVFDSIPGNLQDAVMESAYTAQVHVQGCQEAALSNIVGATSPSLPGTMFDKFGVRVANFSPEELKKTEQMCSPEFQPKPWEQWRERLNGWAGGQDVYKVIYDIAREIPADTNAVNVDPRRWWKSA